jgi:hypothetical protein
LALGSEEKQLGFAFDAVSRAANRGAFCHLWH